MSEDETDRQTVGEGVKARKRQRGGLYEGTKERQEIE